MGESEFSFLLLGEFKKNVNNNSQYALGIFKRHNINVTWKIIIRKETVEKLFSSPNIDTLKDTNVVYNINNANDIYKET